VAPVTEGACMSRRVKPAWEAFRDYILGSLPEHTPAYDAIRRINTGLEEADETKADELELGRNRCALSQRGWEQSVGGSGRQRTGVSLATTPRRNGCRGW